MITLKLPSFQQSLRLNLKESIALKFTHLMSLLDYWYEDVWYEDEWFDNTQIKKEITLHGDI